MNKQSLATVTRYRHSLQALATGTRYRHSLQSKAQSSNSNMKPTVMFINFNRVCRVWELIYLTVCPPCGQSSIPGYARVFREISPWMITLCQLVLSQRDRKWFDFPSMAPLNLWTSRKKAEVDGQTMVERNSAENWPNLFERSCFLYSLRGFF